MLPPVVHNWTYLQSRGGGSVVGRKWEGGLLRALVVP
jgi:hypothetical protein